MSLPEVVRWIVAGLFTAVVAFAAINDLRERKIPNWTVLATLALFAPWVIVHPVAWDLWAVAAGAIALAASFGLYAAGLVGAGDSKLFSAVALFGGLAGLGPLALGTALVGGIVAIVSLLARPTRALVMLKMRGRGDYGRGIPYGVAIAIAGMVLVWAGVLEVHFPFGASHA